MLRILLVDDEPSIRLTLRDALRGAGHEVETEADGEAAIERVHREVFDVLVSDIRLPRKDGIEVFRELRQIAPSTDVILITAFGSVQDAVSAMKDGARDYLTKPFDPEELVMRLARLDDSRRVLSELERARAALAVMRPDVTLVGSSPPMIHLLDQIDTIALSDASVLVTGESGTGKELIAHMLHDRGDRAKRAFVPVNCAAFPETLIEAELFGHERGAFTGAVRKRDGRFKAADGGTLFLDEVAEIPLPTQAKLLRVVQDGVVEPLGTNTPVQVDVRLVCATHRDLKERIKEGRFREDLFYRIRVLDLNVPPLRERMSDLPVLIEHFLAAKSRGGERPVISPRAWAALGGYDYPGNVRELEHAVEHAVVMSRGGEIELQHLPVELSGGVGASGGSVGALRTLQEATKEFEREYLLRALKETEGVRTRAAELLGISRKNLWEKLRDHEVKEVEFTS